MLEEISAYIQAAGIATAGTDLFLGEYPDAPDELIALIETEGPGPTYTMDRTGPSAVMPRLQVLVRALDYPTARSRAQAIYDLLAGIVNTALSGVRYTSCTPVNSAPFFLERDANNRPIVVSNYQFDKEPG